MMMRVIRACLAVSLLLPGVAAAQFSDSYTFLKAVRDRDGDKATTLINKPGSGAVIIDTRDPATGEGAVHIVTKRRDLAWLNFLLAKGANANARDAQGNSALMLATQIAWTDGIALLIQRRAQVDLPNNSGETPLIRAVQNRDIESVRALLAAGANPNRADTGAGLSARDYAKRDVRSAAILAAIDQARPRPKAAIGPN